MSFAGVGRSCVVEAVATGGQGFSVSDEIVGIVCFPSMGASAGYNEYVAAPASDLALKSADIDQVLVAGAPCKLCRTSIPAYYDRPLGGLIWIGTQYDWE